MESSNRRADYRVEVPGSYVREIAVWFCPCKNYVRLSAGELARPHLLSSRLGSGRMVLSDLSIRGFGLMASIPQEAIEKLLSAKACFSYLQLWDPSADDPYGVLSVFTYNDLVRVAEKDGALFLGSRFVRFAVGSRLEKSLEFLDAQACGVTALAHWCDNISRGKAIAPGRPCGGLDMDNLLTEIETALTNSCQGGEEQS